MMVEHVSTRHETVWKATVDSGLSQILSVSGSRWYFATESLYFARVSVCGMGNIDPQSIEPDLRYDRLARKYCTPSIRIVYRHIRDRLYWGVQEKRTRLGSYKIAEPEKTLLDWIYLQRQDGLQVALDDQL